MKIATFLVLLCPLLGNAQNNTEDSLFIHSIAVNILSSNASYDNLHYLTKNIGGRLAGSPQMVMAENWGTKAMKEAGAQSVIQQKCAVPHWVRGGKAKASGTYKDIKGKEQSYWLNI